MIRHKKDNQDIIPLFANIPSNFQSNRLQQLRDVRLLEYTPAESVPRNRF